MTATIREQVLQAFHDKLSAIEIAGLRVDRNRDTPVEDYPSIVMVDGGQVADAENPGVKDIEMRVDVECFVRANTPGELAPAFDEIYGKTVQAVLADRTLGALAVDIDEDELDDPIIAREEGVGPTLAASLSFTVRYWVDPDDPYTLAS